LGRLTRPAKLGRSAKTSKLPFATRWARSARSLSALLSGLGIKTNIFMALDPRESKNRAKTLPLGPGRIRGRESREMGKMSAGEDGVAGTGTRGGRGGQPEGDMLYFFRRV
jgi:hypothetical protein